MFYIRKLYSTEVLVTLNLPSVSSYPIPPFQAQLEIEYIYCKYINSHTNTEYSKEIAATNAYTNTNTVGKQCVNATGKQSNTITNREGKSKQEIGKRELGKTLRKLKAQAEAEAEAAAESAVAQAETALASSRAQSVCAREFATSRGTHTHAHAALHLFRTQTEQHENLLSCCHCLFYSPLPVRLPLPPRRVQKLCARACRCICLCLRARVFVCACVYECVCVYER